MEPLSLTRIPNHLLGFSFIIGLFATILIIPPLVRFVGFIGFADKPSPRKIHHRAVPRVGGIGIAIGVLIPVLLWAPLDPTLFGYLVGAFVILIGGIWDDYKSLSQQWKVLFQLVGISIAIWSGIRIEHVPFFGLDAVPDWISYPLTFLFLLGITNATNLFDGLDGLAGGCVLLSLGVIAAFSHVATGNVITLIALSMIGATLGFLRFNTYPASVFMGDAGSQLLGFTTAVLSILLIERTHSALNFGLPLLILGLPILDTGMVIVLRLKNGHSPFRPDQRHLHHQLLKVGFSHASAVALLYVIQALMVIAAYFMRFQTDLLVVAAFVSICALVLGSIYVARTTGFQLNGARPDQPKERHAVQWTQITSLATGVRRYLEFSLAALFLFVGIVFEGIPHDLAVFSLMLAAALVFAFFFMKSWSVFFSRLGVYTVGLLTSIISLSMVGGYPLGNFYFKLFLGSLVLCIIFIILFDNERPFQITPLDLLIFFLAVTVPVFAGERNLDFPIAKHALTAGAIIYACECVISAAPQRHRVLKISALSTLVLIGIKGIL